jgi:ferric-dicitrate binding protein FerR (iron transport regulator)
MPPEERIYYLFDQYIGDSASAEELEELKLFLNNPSYEETAKNHLLSLLRVTEPMAAASEDRLQAVLRKIKEEEPTLRKNRDEAPGSKMTPKPYSRQLPFIRRWWAVAALLIGTAVAVWLLIRPKTPAPAVAGQKTLRHDRAPGRNVAKLTLADGSSITLDSAHNGFLTQQGNASITKSGDGSLAYRQAEDGKTVAVYNMLSTPRGGQYRLLLPDGSQVWLNAASSISYPTAFTGEERSVTITGEAYFEIAPNPTMPFHVRVNTPQGQKDIRVLGTHFNVKAYGDETTVTTTLLEGSVQLLDGRQGKSGGAGTILKPGEQGQWRADGTMQVDAHANIEEAVAWKNGLFHFEGADVAEVMRQISRWYDVDVVFKGKLPDAKFEGEITRSSNLTEVFKILQLSNVHFTVEDKKVIVEQ